MASLNEVRLMGRLGQDPVLEHTRGNLPFCRFSLATSFLAKDGERKVEWHRLVCFDRQAQAVAKCLRKGSLAYIEGSLHTRRRRFHACVKKERT